ncbi:MAG TPA: ATP-binding protein [Ohtaekwangia sp.]|nr:ATP-binding protein [Ohtaekwangia sp.]
MRWSKLMLFLVGILAAMDGTAQEYRFRQYRVEQGLPSDIVKAVTQDSLRFIWIATDDGLVKYDGLRFTTYKSALRSQYAKGFLHTRSGRLLCFGDLDLIEIQNSIDTVVFKPLLAGTRSPTDSTIWYPKTAYEDRAGNIWLAESQSIVRYDGKMKRYAFGPETRSTVFLRSFHFFEDDDGEFYTVSFHGKIFRYEKDTDTFQPLSGSVLPAGINHLEYLQQQLWVATQDGFYHAAFKDERVLSLTRVLPIPNTSYFTLAADSSWWISTFGSDLYRLRHDQQLDAIPYNFKGINTTYYSREGDLWAATDKGLVLAQKNQFILADMNSQTHFVEAIAQDPARDVYYYCSKEMVQRVQWQNGDNVASKVIYNDRDCYFQSLQYGRQGLWASSTSRVMLFQDDVLRKQWDFSSEGDFIHDIFLDSQQDLWISQAGNRNIIIIRDGFDVERVSVPINQQTEINLVREGPMGIYAGAGGMEGYLFLKRNNENEFKNISLPVNFEVESDFNIHDIAIQDSVLWLASTEGLLRYDHTTLQRVDLGEVFTNFSISSVAIFDSVNILFSNSYGLFRYNILSREYWLYDENAGLPSNTITAGGIFVDHRKRLWVGTSFGLAISEQPVTVQTPTPRPLCVAARVNGSSRRFMGGLQVPYSAFVHLEFSPITFPENKINLQWRWASDKIWHAMDGPTLSLSNLQPGEHLLEVRGKKNTGQGWSAVNRFTIVVARPYWQRAEFVFLVVFFCLFIAWVSYAVASRILQRRKAFLEKLVNERTHELQQTNEELKLRNTELDRFVYSASHDLSAPLKSILGLITVARMDNPDKTHIRYLTMMEGSVKKLEEFIREVVSYSRNTRMPVKIESCSFKEIIDTILPDHQYAPNYEKITFRCEDKTGQPMRTDVMRLKIILNNLISNAIKFHRFDNQHQPFVKISLSAGNGHYILQVEDNGSGIEEHHLQHIFDMFYRASEQSQGSGLGLYILKESVAKLNGKVEAQSRPGNGTTFTVILPIPSF